MSVDVAIVATAQRQVEALIDETEVELMAPLISAVRDEAGVGQDEIGFTCSGSSDFLAGMAFSFVMTLDGVGAVPPISESHVDPLRVVERMKTTVPAACSTIYLVGVIVSDAS